jgi:ABC-type uncharacterized transport system substrate-binding protein
MGLRVHDPAMLRRVACAAALLAWAAGPAAAHPHIFIDTGLEVIFDDQGRAAAVRVAWVYDDFYSLTMIQDLQLDADYDGTLTSEEEGKLSGFDMNWDADYEGDLYVLVGETPVNMGRPHDWTATYQDGRIISTHVRALEAPVELGAEPLVIQVYDPGFYTAYTILGTPVLTHGDDCKVEVFEPDLTEADKQLQAMLQEYTADQSLEQDFPAVGAAYAEEARVTCGS